MSLNASLVNRFQLPVIASVAPSAYLALEGAWRAASSALDVDLLTLIIDRVEALLEAGESPSPNSAAGDGYLAAVTAVIDQFVCYVPDIDDEMLKPLREKLKNADLRALIDAIYIVDQTTRLRVTHRRLFEDRAFTDDFPSWPPDARILTPTRANMVWHDATLAPRPDNPEAMLDIFVREAVRLRAGWYHQCGMCNSLRMVEDGVRVVNAATEKLVIRPDFGDSGLPAATKLALRYADAHMVEPASITDELKDDLFTHFTRDQVAQLTLEVSSWNYQKVPVALHVDKPVREGQLTAMVIDEHGAAIFGEPIS